MRIPLLAPLLTAALAVSVARPAGAVASAELIKNQPEGYGRFEARVRFAAGDGVVSSFFLWKLGSEVAGTFWNELDVEKVGAACEYSSNAIYGLPMANHTLKIADAGDLCGAYRTHAFEWTPDYIAWFLDGREVRRLEGEAATAFRDNASAGMQFRFNVWPGNASFGGNFVETILPVRQFVASAAYYEHAPGAGDGGGDFRFVWREEFDGTTLPSGWSTGTWQSPFARSTHSPQNVTVTGGMAVLSLTPDGALGFDGAPPPDGGSGASAGAAGSSGGSAGASTAGGSGGSVAGAAGSAAAGDGDEGCGCRLTRRAPGSAAFHLGLALFCLARRRSRRGSRSAAHRSARPTT